MSSDSLILDSQVNWKKKWDLFISVVSTVKLNLNLILFCGKLPTEFNISPFDTGVSCPHSNLITVNSCSLKERDMFLIMEKRNRKLTKACWFGYYGTEICCIQGTAKQCCPSYADRYLKLVFNSTVMYYI